MDQISQVTKQLLASLLCKSDDKSALYRATYYAPSNPALSALKYLSAHQANESVDSQLLTDLLSEAFKELFKSLWARRRLVFSSQLTYTQPG